MKNIWKRAFSLLMTLGLCINALGTLTTGVFAAETEEEIQKGEFVYAPHTYTEGDLTDIYYYSDSFFSASAFDYNAHLATMSMILASASISSQDPDTTYETKSRNLESLFKALDFSNFQVNEYYKARPEEQTMGVGIAMKQIGEGDEAFTLLAIVPRSAGYEKEWAGNFTVGKEGLHQGFEAGRDIILEFAKRYVEVYEDDFESEVKVWTVGYSRGAGVANLLAAYLNDNPDELGVTLEKENIFAYTFGTPSNVQFADVDADEATVLSKKLQLENDYKNIFNRYSEYDIISFVPFKDWNFGYYGVTKLFDVHNAQSKAKMLTYLEQTNKTIYDIYTEPNSSADPDNFAAVMLEVGEGDEISFVPAKAEYGIPSNQKDFFTQRVSFLVNALVPDRNVYVDGGYEYALQCLTSLYFGLNSEQGSALLSGMSEDLPLALAAYYAYFLSDFYLDTEEGLATVVALVESLPMLEAYVDFLANDETVNTSALYLYVSTFIASEEYLQIKTTLQSVGSNIETLKENVEDIQTTFEELAVGMTIRVLSSGVSALDMDETEKQNYLTALTSEEVAKPLTRFIVYLLLGDEDVSEPNAFDPSNKNVALAATFIANAGRYMRSHNNEIILSWLRTEDSYYENESWHVHEYMVCFDSTGHWEECDCGEKSELQEHAFGSWNENGVDENGNKTYSRKCHCGYEEIDVREVVELEKKDTPSATAIIFLCIGSAVFVGVATVIVYKKRKSVK